MKKITTLVLFILSASWCSAFTDVPIKAQSQFEDVTMDVPYIATSAKAVESMLELAKVGPHDIVYDLGSGDGRIVIAAAKNWGAARGVGVEIDSELVRESRIKAKFAQVADRVEFIAEDLFNVDIRPATVVTLYLMPEINLRLRPTLLTALRPGSRVVSHSWDMAEWQPDEARLSPSLSLRMFPDKTFRRSWIYLWIIPVNVSGIWQWQDTDGKTSQKVRITQRFQKGEGIFLTSGEGKMLQLEVRGEQVRLIVKGELAPVVFEGRAQGDIIDGTVTSGKGPQAQKFPWKAIRQPGTVSALEGSLPGFSGK